MFLLEQNSIRKKQVDKNVIKFDIDKNKKYKIEAICDNTVYARKSKVIY